ncbi:MAG: hypothetical protein ABFD69_08820 [Candidatus Sumerlaeia bacterium]
MNAKSFFAQWWGLIAIGVLAALVFIGFLAIRALFVVRAVRPNQMQPPATMLALRIPSQPLAPVSSDYNQFLLASPNKTAATIYTKYAPKYSSQDAWTTWPLKNWRPPQPLAADQTAWLAANQEFIIDLETLASAGGIPMASCEQAIANERNNTGIVFVFNQTPIPELSIFHFGAVMLAAECRRLRTNGEMSRAAECLLAIYPLSRSIREPGTLNHLIAIAMQNTANEELGQWIGTGNFPAEFNQRFQERITADAITLANYRRILDVEYCCGRNYLIAALNGPVGDLVIFNVLIELAKGTSRNRKTPPENGNIVAQSAGVVKWQVGAWIEAAKMKANASSIVERYDANYMKLAQSINNQPITMQQSDDPLDIIIPNEPETRTRTLITEAKAGLVSEGLGLLVGSNANQNDPFAQKPMNAIRETTSTLIYSIGPDYADQRGAISYDPTNGIFSGGDILIRIPRR